MNNVRIISDGSSTTVGVTLHNGDLVLAYSEGKLGCVPEVTDAFLVTSFRNSKKTNPDRWDSTGAYCSFVSLDRGAIAFEEPCSRATTYGRIESHLSGRSLYGQKFRVKVIPKGTYTVDVCIGTTK